MKEKIYEVIKQSGKAGIRLRDIGRRVGMWHVNCLADVYELIDEGRVVSKTIGQGWEAYIKYYVKES